MRAGTLRPAAPPLGRLPAPSPPLRAAGASSPCRPSGAGADRSGAARAGLAFWRGRRLLPPANPPTTQPLPQNMTSAPARLSLCLPPARSAPSGTGTTCCRWPAAWRLQATRPRASWPPTCLATSRRAWVSAQRPHRLPASWPQAVRCRRSFHRQHALPCRAHLLHRHAAARLPCLTRSFFFVFALLHPHRQARSCPTA